MMEFDPTRYYGGGRYGYNPYEVDDDAQSDTTDGWRLTDHRCAECATPEDSERAYDHGQRDARMNFGADDTECLAYLAGFDEAR